MESTPKISRAGQNAGGSARSPLAVASVAFSALVLAGLCYRAVLLAHLLTEEVTPFSFVPSAYSISRMLLAAGSDALVYVPLAVLAGAASALARKLSGAEVRGALRRTGLFVGGTLLLILGLLNASNLRLLLSMHCAVDLSVLADIWSAGSHRDLLDYGHATDVALMLVPLAAATAWWLVTARSPRAPVRAGLGLSVLSLLLVVPSWFIPVPALYPPKLAAALYDAPLLHLALDVREALRRKRQVYARRSDRIALQPYTGPRFDPPTAPWDEGAARANEPPLNVLLVIMESTGARYVFDNRHGPVPMPRLKELSRQGLMLLRHYATSNTSPRAIFSIFTGMYPQPTRHMFATRPDVRLAGLGRFLGPRYERFFVTPGRLQSYLPRGMLVHDGMREMYGYDELPIAEPIELPGGGRSEIQTADFFLERMAKAKEPFFATYYSYAPHFGYYDQGEQFRVRKDLSDAKSRYYNSMRLLDAQIGRFVDQLRDSGRLERTVVLLVGDHGEAFGQHPDNYTHSRMSYEENLRVPAVLYQPKLFSPKALAFATSHVDLLPTLLDAMGIAYDPTRMQGTSLMRGVPERSHVYAWGSEGMLSSIDAQGERKLQVSFERDLCRYFDLRRDPWERTAKRCRGEVDAQLDALLRFYKFQRTALAQENARIKE